VKKPDLVTGHCIYSCTHRRCVSPCSLICPSAAVQRSQEHIALSSSSRETRLAIHTRIHVPPSFSLIHHNLPGMSENRDGPPLLRPIPRRPFNLNLTGPTSPEENADSPVSQQPPPQPFNSFDRNPGLNLDSLNRRLLDPRNNTPSRFDNSGSETISRAQSFLNLTSSTLCGIYSDSPTLSTFSGGGGYGGDGGSLRDRRFFMDQDEPTTPWGTGAETPAKRLSVDEPYYDVHRERAGIIPPRGRTARRRSSALQSSTSGTLRRAQPLSRPAAAFYMGLRGLLLFGLGILYGALVARFQDRHNKTLVGKVQGSSSPTYDANYMAFWGVSGVALGALLPWFDGVWESIFGQRDDDIITGGSAAGEDSEDDQGTDWALVVRGVGAFVGIVFAIVSCIPEFLPRAIQSIAFALGTHFTIVVFMVQLANVTRLF
jgi:hypothetical protein